MDPDFLLICACLFGSLCLFGLAFSPSTETSSISQRLEGLKAGIRPCARKKGRCAIRMR